MLPVKIPMKELVIKVAQELLNGGYSRKNTTHHGILIFGIIQIFKALPEIMHGLKELETAMK